MRVLITGSRMPFALAMVRKLAEEGHEVFASDAYSFLSLARSERLRHRDHEELFVAMAGDISWDGDPIAGMSAEDRALLDAG